MVWCSSQFSCTCRYVLILSPVQHWHAMPVETLPHSGANGPVLCVHGARCLRSICGQYAKGVRFSSSICHAKHAGAFLALLQCALQPVKTRQKSLKLSECHGKHCMLLASCDGVQTSSPCSSTNALQCDSSRGVVHQ
jgi:hypothetical protein